MGNNSKIYEIVTERIIELLEEGTVPWHKPWKGGAGQAPMNMVSGKPYRGVNIFLLATQGYDSPYWLSFNQIKKKGGQVVKGEKSTLIIFWKFLEKSEKDENGEEKIRKVGMLRYYRVFNLEQTEGLKLPVTGQLELGDTDFDFQPIEICEGIVKSWDDCPKINHQQNRAYYRPSSDSINMPKHKRFDSEEEYYSTLFHEMSHSTGHSSRLDRDSLTALCPFGSTNYSKEELVAEMGAAMLCGMAGIENDTIDNSAAYIKGWLKKLNDNPKWVIQAAGKAQKSCDLILGKVFKN